VYEVDFLLFSGIALSTSTFISSVTKANRSPILTLILMRDLKSVLKIGEYLSGISWGIFGHVTSLDQLRASENI